MRQQVAWIKNRIDHLVAGISAIGIAICIILLTSESAYDYFFPRNLENTQAPIVGEISFQENDTRHKSSISLAWEPAKGDQRIRAGDSVFTGQKSQSRVRMNQGGEVVLDENSMVRFSKVDQIDIPDLSIGNFTVAVNGTMKIAINGMVTEIEGANSQIQISMANPKKPQLRLTQGSAKIKTTKFKKELIPNKVMRVHLSSPPKKNEAQLKKMDSGIKDLELSSLNTDMLEESDIFLSDGLFEVTDVKAEELPGQQISDGIEENTPVAVPIVKANELVPQAVFKDSSYILSFYDEFEIKNNVIFKRQNPRVIVDVPVEVSWQSEGNFEKVYGQLSQSADFKSVFESFAVNRTDSKSVFPRAARGRNYFRLSMDGYKWTDAQSFEIKTKNLDMAPPVLKKHSSKINILQEYAVISEGISSPLSNIVVEISTDLNFPARKTKVLWLENKKLKYTVAQEATLFFRFRGVDSSMKMTAASPVYRYEVFKPLLPESPSLSQNILKGLEGDDIQVSWQNAPRARSFQIQLLDTDNKTVEKIETANNSFKFTPKKPGKYKVHIKSSDIHGRSSENFSEAQVIVSKKPTLVKPTLPVNPADEKRQVAAVPVTAPQERTGPPAYLEKSNLDSMVLFEGSGMSMFSQEQISQEKANPIAGLFGLRWQVWNGAHGFEGAAKTKVSNIESTAESDVSPLVLEARYRHRWDMAFNPFSKLKKSDFILIAGLESYKNAGQKLFSPGYDLFKLGFGLDFPILSQFKTGGEVLYGVGLDSSKKYEVNGNLIYSFNRAWSLGLGYRVHLFEAGSAAVSPLRLPYKEGYGEGYSVLRWHY